MSKEIEAWIDEQRDVLFVKIRELFGCGKEGVPKKRGIIVGISMEKICLASVPECQQYPYVVVGDNDITNFTVNYESFMKAFECMSEISEVLEIDQSQKDKLAAIKKISSRMDKYFGIGIDILTGKNKEGKCLNTPRR